MACFDFVKLCVPLRPQLLAHAYRLTNGNRMRAEDIVQDAMVRAWRNWESWKPSISDHATGDAGAVKAWLYRIVTNVYLNDYTSQQSQARMLEAAALEHLVREGEDAYELPADFGAEVHAVLARIYPGYRQVVEMHYVKGMSCKEIAAELGIETGTVLSRLWRARDALKPLLARLAQVEYGYPSDCAGEDPNPLESPETPKSDASRVQRVVRGDDTAPLDVAQCARSSGPAW